MDKTDRIYKILRCNLNATQAKELANQIEQLFEETDLNYIERCIDDVKATIISGKKLAKYDVEATELADKLKNYVVDLFPWYENSFNLVMTAREIQAITKMNEKFNYAVIEAVMDWVFTFESSSSTFWQGNIRSGQKLRKHFLELLTKAKSEMQDSAVVEV